MFGEQSEFVFFDCIFGILCDREDVKGNLKGFRDGFEVRVVRDNEANVAIEFAGSVSQEQLPETVIVFADHNGHLLARVAPIQCRVHFEASANFVDPILQGDAIGQHLGGIEMYALKEERGTMIGVLLTINDAAAVSVQKLREGGHDAVRVRPVHPERTEIGGRGFRRAGLLFQACC